MKVWYVLSRANGRWYAIPIDAKQATKLAAEGKTVFFGTVEDAVRLETRVAS